MCQELNNICIINFEKKIDFCMLLYSWPNFMQKLKEKESNKQKKIVKDVKNYKLNLLNKQNLMRKGL